MEGINFRQLDSIFDNIDKDLPTPELEKILERVSSPRGKEAVIYEMVKHHLYQVTQLNLSNYIPVEEDRINLARTWVATFPEYFEHAKVALKISDQVYGNLLSVAKDNLRKR